MRLIDADKLKEKLLQIIEEEECKFGVPVCKICGHRLDDSDTVEEEPW